MGHEFTNAIRTYFVPFLEEYGFALSEPMAISGKHYFARFTSGTGELFVSYEPGEDYLHVGFGSPLSENRPPELTDVPVEAYRENTDYFAGREATSDLEKKLLKAARDLRLRLRVAAQPAVAADGASPRR